MHRWGRAATGPGASRCQHADAQSLRGQGVGGSSRREGKRLPVRVQPRDTAHGCQGLSSRDSGRWCVAPRGADNGVFLQAWLRGCGPITLGLRAQVAWSPLTLWLPGAQHSFFPATYAPSLLGGDLPHGPHPLYHPLRGACQGSSPWGLGSPGPSGAMGVHPPHPHTVREVPKGKSQPGSGTPTYHSEQSPGPRLAGSQARRAHGAGAWSLEP